MGASVTCGLRGYSINLAKIARRSTIVLRKEITRVCKGKRQVTRAVLNAIQDIHQGAPR